MHAEQAQRTKAHLALTLKGLKLVKQNYTPKSPMYLCSIAQMLCPPTLKTPNAEAVRAARDLWIRALGGYGSLGGWLRENGNGPATEYRAEKVQRELRIKWLDKMSRDIKAQIKAATQDV